MSAKKFISKLSRYKFKLLAALIIMMIFSIRLTALTSDLPNWGIGQYQAPDEGPYGYLALNQINYGQINPDFDKSQDFNQYTAPHLRENILGNIVTYICLQMFGDNYVGFRMGSFIFMFINLLLIYSILSIMGQKYSVGHQKIGRYSKYLITFLLLIDFTFTLASKVVETSIYRLFCILLCLYIYIKLEDSQKMRFILLGFISVFSVCAIYITNLFLVLSISLTVLVYGLKNIRTRYQCIIFYIGGGSAAYGLCELYYRIFWHTSFLKNTFDTLQNFSSIDEYSQNLTVYYFFKRGLLFLSSNFNVYNISVFFVFLIVLPLIIIRLWQNKEEFLILNLSLYLSLFCQTIYSEDYIQRKYLLVVPSLLFLCVLGITKINSIKHLLNRPLYKISYTMYIFFAAILCSFILLYRFHWNSDGSLFDYSRKDIQLLLFGGIFVIAVMFIMAVGYIWLQKLKLLNLLLICIIFSNIGFNLYLDINYIYTHKTYSDKKIMVKLKSYENKKGKTYILGDYMLSYCLYNDIVPVVNDYDQMFFDMIHNNMYLFGYSTKWNTAFGNAMKDTLYKNGYKYKIVKEFPRKQTTFGEHRDVALYKAVKIKDK